MAFGWKDEVVLVTGATSGLGRALALRTGKLGAAVIMIARRKERLAETAEGVKAGGGKPFYYQFDLQDIHLIPELYKTIKGDSGRDVTVLINSVGSRVAGFVQNTPVALYEKNYKVNTLAPIALIQCVLPGMLSMKKGVIGNVMGSIMHAASPGVSCYSASKNALMSVHESLKTELSGTGVRTLSIWPGNFKSDHWKNIDIGNRIAGFKIPSGKRARDAAVVAEKICEAIEEGKENLDLRTMGDKIIPHLSYWSPRILEKILLQRNKSLLARRPSA